jgi:hypothetical protein
MEKTKWTVAYASVIGSSHSKENLPCQDACEVKNLAEGWGIATLSDGAGSCRYADQGAQKTVQFAIHHFSNWIHRNHWIEKNYFPKEEEWHRISLDLLKVVKEDLLIFSKQNDMEFESLSCTLILLIYTPLGGLLTHIGDGRVGYLNTKQEWHSLMTPFKGEEANQTLFITSDFEEYVESKAINEKILAFCLLSDGCEKSAFECNLYDREKGVYYDPNRPYPKFFDPNINAIKALEKQNKTQEEINVLWQNFLENGTPQLKNETDDKTLILGVTV